MKEQAQKPTTKRITRKSLRKRFVTTCGVTLSLYNDISDRSKGANDIESIAGFLASTDVISYGEQKVVIKTTIDFSFNSITVAEASERISKAIR